MSEEWEGFARREGISTDVAPEEVVVTIAEWEDAQATPASD